MPVCLAAQGSKTAAPALEVDHTAYNFGEVITGELPVHTFQVHNTGDAPLKLSETPMVGVSEVLPNWRPSIAGAQLLRVAFTRPSLAPAPS